MAKTDIDASEILNDALDVMENTMDLIENQVERVVTVTKNNPFALGAVLLIGIGIGGAVAYKVASKRTSVRYEDYVANEIEAAKQFYKRLAKEGEFDTPESAAEVLLPDNVVESIRNYQGRPDKVPYNHPEQITEVVATQEKTTLTVKNVFDATSDVTFEWDWPTENLIREEKPDYPYVIHFDEFTENEDGHDQATLTYFQADNTLVDERDSPQDNVEYLIGEMNLKRFGHGSHQANVVYIRNERLSQDFEVHLSTGSYAHEVMNEPETPGELKHSQRHPNRSDNRTYPRRFRGTDE